MNVFIVVYSHDHGIDAIPCSVESRAIREAQKIVDTYRNDFFGTENGTIDNWFEHTGGKETLEIQERPVYTLKE